MSNTVPKLRSRLKGQAPGIQVEKRLWAADYKVVVGVDEVGRGAWAGPITVGAAVIPKDRRLYKLRDSKMLTEAEREALFGRIAEWCDTWATGHASHEECDRLGMSDAQRLAARRALSGLEVVPDRILLDGRWDFVGGTKTIKIVRGDATSLSISAASILAKVTRDRMMRSLAPHYPNYGFEDNKGYPCPTHKAGLQAWGPSAIHRRSWVFMDYLPWTGIPRYLRPDNQGILFDPDGE
ncbi:MAG: ribonuclease HII [Acidimicrobiia bacterium]|nr:ribonuclease HII [Acidimicrobiia bacterium]MYH54635.1 ribonuclease HII [Acidimicrobiia bacterium]